MERGCEFSSVLVLNVKHNKDANTSNISWILGCFGMRVMSRYCMFLAVECLLVYRKDIAAQTDRNNGSLVPREQAPQIDFISLSLVLRSTSCFLTVRSDSLQSLYPPEGKERTTLIKKKKRVQRRNGPALCKLLHIPERNSQLSTVALRMLSNMCHERL